MLDVSATRSAEMTMPRRRKSAATAARADQQAERLRIVFERSRIGERRQQILRIGEAGARSDWTR